MEEEMKECRHCQSSNLTKYGKTGWGNRRYKCKDCKKVMNRPKLRGKSPETKALAILLYGAFSASFRGIARLLNVSDVAVLKWVRNFAKTLERPKIPAPKEGAIIVLDEMWHFVNGKPNKLWIWKAYDLEKKRTFAWKFGKRDAATLKEFLDEIGIDERDFVTDDYEAYHSLIPEAQLSTGKDLTYPIEQEQHKTFHRTLPPENQLQERRNGRSVTFVAIPFPTWQSVRDFSVCHPPTSRLDVSKADYRNCEV
jgi:IS1 family transposase/transposase-like protein